MTTPSTAPEQTAPKTLAELLPDGITEEAFMASLQEIVDLVDLDSLANARELPGLKHPLTIERIGVEAATKNELRDLIESVVIGATIKSTINNESQLKTNAAYITQVLLEHSTNPTKLQAALLALCEVAKQIEAKNPSHHGIEASLTIGQALKSILPGLPIDKQLGSHPFITLLSKGVPTTEVLKNMAACHAQVTKWFESNETQAAILAEMEAVKAWMAENPLEETPEA